METSGDALPSAFLPRRRLADEPGCPETLDPSHMTSTKTRWVWLTHPEVTAAPAAKAPWCI
jgi:hypothetical protein